MGYNNGTFRGKVFKTPYVSITSDPNGISLINARIVEILQRPDNKLMMVQSCQQAEYVYFPENL